MELNDRLHAARKILQHQNFSKLTPEQIQAVYRNLLSQGITKTEINQILEEKRKEITYLENLPYNVFVNLVLVGQINGRDLVNFCNSSPLINDKCNKPFKSESGHIIPQFIFTVVLQKMGIPVRENPREQYVNLIQHKSLNTFTYKLSIILDLLERRNFEFPNTIYDLIYGFRNFSFELLEQIGNLNPESKTLINSLDKLIRELEFSNNPDYNHIVKTHVSNFLELLDYFRQKGFGGDLKYNYLGYESLKSLISQKDFSDANLIFGQVLKELLEKYNYTNQNLRDYMKRKWETNQIFEILEYSDTLEHFYIRNAYFQAFGIRVPEDDPEGLLDLERRREDEEMTFEEKQKALENIKIFQEIFRNLKQNLDFFKHLSEDELDYLTYLHYKVYSGELPVLEAFTYKDLFGY